ncbi:heterokaryon incompatibility protein-domain-containing protein, partial [Lophiotrema nucula]
MAQHDQDHRAIVPSMGFPILSLDPDCDFQEDQDYECPYKAEYTLEVTYQDMVESGRRGCKVCYIYSYAMIQTKLDLFYDNSEVHMASWFHHRGIDCFNHWGGPLNKESHPLEFICDARDPGIRSAIQNLPQTLSNERKLKAFDCDLDGAITKIGYIEHLPSGETSSDMSFRRAKEWIARCDINHSCRKEVAPMLPKRVVGLARDRIYIHESHGERGAYACLSHCWGPKGNDILLKTKKEVLATFKESIQWTALPKTFQDAIIACRRLGIDWIWIDSLCIVQDDPLDWQLESAKMATIYENAYLTLAATFAEDASGGLFTGPDCTDHNAKSTPLLLQFPNGPTVPLICRRRLNHQHFPLIRRAWVYQERLLSPRILHFAGFELIWECLAVSSDCECGSAELLQTRSRDYLKNRNWRELVAYYLALELSHPSDIFPALSGLADRFIRNFGDEYVAGMWKSTLIRDL